MKKRFTPIVSSFKQIGLLWAIFLFFPSFANAFEMPKQPWELDGFVRNNTAVWLESMDYVNNQDPLASFRNWFRLNLNGGFTSNLDLKAEVLAVYEPEYEREEGGGIPANEYNYFDFRELRLDWRITPLHSLRIGRQIVNWGESISARVGDVINPVDSRFDLGFTNLEDTRMPIWMIRGLHLFTSINTSLDWVFSPYIQADRYRVNRTPSAALTVNSDGSFTPAPRFAAYPEIRMEKLFGTRDAVIAIPGAGPGGTTLVVPGPLAGPPFSFIYQGADIFGGPTAPIDAAMAESLFGPAFAGTPYPASGIYLTRPPVSTTDYPDSSLEDARWGFKTSSILAGWQTGVYFWHSNELSPTIRVKGGLGPIGTPLNLVVEYPKQNVYGFFANKNFSFGVLAFDVAYRPDRQYNTLDFAKYPEGITEKDNLLAQARLNKDLMIRSLNKYATFSLIVEYVGEFILDDLDDIHVPTYFITYHKDSHTFLTSFSTGYRANMYKPGVTVLYNLRGSGLIQPEFTYTPDILDSNLSFKLQWANVFGDSFYEYPYGLLKDSDMLILTTQFSF
ncbi:MAG: DUF1302 family protein [Desulfobacterales bacterium]